jgi:hypothetical protein
LPSVATTCTGPVATMSRQRLPAWADASAVPSIQFTVPPGLDRVTAASGQPSASQGVSRLPDGDTSSAGST